MNRGKLSDYFEGVIATKRLSAVEADTRRSNQHEFNGVAQLKEIFGAEEPQTLDALFVWLGGEQDAVSEQGYVTWYDARRAHPKRSEYRLYFPTNAVTELASENDLLLIAKRPNGRIIVVVAPDGSTMVNQLSWLFGLSEQINFNFSVSEINTDEYSYLDFAATFILEEIGIEIEDPDADRLDTLVGKFGAVFPPTRVFSEFARQTAPKVSPQDDPDGALISWMDHEEALFRRLERQILKERLSKGFLVDGAADVDGFVSYSLQVQNRRKSRAGYALCHHLESIFVASKVHFKREAFTEKKNGPDFLFPGENEYQDKEFPPERLHMLAVKTSCKDRWRQVLAEANRISHKHLLTLEPGISETQTREMQTQSLQLILPQAIHPTYKPAQQKWLMNLAEFVALVAADQSS